MRMVRDHFAEMLWVGGDLNRRRDPCVLVTGLTWNKQLISVRDDDPEFGYWSIADGLPARRGHQSQPGEPAVQSASDLVSAREEAGQRPSAHLSQASLAMGVRSSPNFGRPIPPTIQWPRERVQQLGRQRCCPSRR